MVGYVFCRGKYKHICLLFFGHLLPAASAGGSSLGMANTEQLDLSGLSVIHVTGTKGKGSTCAMVESILRHHGFKTGKDSRQGWHPYLEPPFHAGASVAVLLFPFRGYQFCTRWPCNAVPPRQ